MENWELSGQRAEREVFTLKWSRDNNVIVVLPSISGPNIAGITMSFKLNYYKSLFRGF